MSTSTLHCAAPKDQIRLEGKAVLFLVTEDWYFWMHRLGIARAVQEAGARVIVATAPGSFRARIEGQGFEYRTIKLRRKSLNPINEARALVDLWHLYRSVRPDVVHQVSLKPVLYGSVAAKCTGVNSVINAITGLGYVFLQENGRRRWLKSLVEAAYRFCLRGEKVRVLFENPDDLRVFVDRALVRRDKARLVSGTGVDPVRFAPSREPDGVVVVLLAARMIWEKGVGVMVQAAQKLKQRKVGCRVVLCGVPDHQNPSAISESQLRRWHEGGLVEWIGFSDNMPQVIARSHIVCLPSAYREGIPVSLIEGASCGRALVTTDAPGCREIVRHNWNGLLVPVNDAPALANAIEQLVRQPDLRRQMGQRGREMVLSGFSEAIVHRQILEVYRDLVGYGHEK